MKNLKTISTLACTALLSLTNCDKHKQNTDMYLYVKEASSKTTLQLYVDEKHEGQLPFFNTNNATSIDSIKNAAIRLSIPFGKHSMEAKDINGTTVLSVKVKINSNKCETSESIGLAGVVNSPDTSIFYFSYSPQIQN